MGIQRWIISAVSGLALAALLAYAGSTCDGCRQSVEATGTSSTTAPPEPVEALTAEEVDKALEVKTQLQNFAALSAASTTTETTAATDEDTTTTDGEDQETTSSTSAGEETTATTAAGDAATTGDGDNKGDGDGESSGGTTTSTTAETTTTTSPPPPPPPPSGSNVPVNGSKIYVDPVNGNDGNNGTSESSALRSLQNALRRVQAGQTVLLMNGEYRELKTPGQLHYFIKNSGNAGNWIRITNAPGHSPVIVANNGTALIVEANYIEISGIRVRGEGFSTSNSWGTGFAISNSHHVRILNCSISGMPVAGISANESSNVHLIGNSVYENSFWSDVNGSGISFFHQRNHGQGADHGQYHDVVMNNRVFRNENKVPSKWKDHKIITDGNGIIIDSNQKNGYSGRTLIANNLVFDNGGRGIIAFESNRVDILFNTTYMNGRTPVIIGGAAELVAFRVNDVKVHHNIGWARSGIPALVIKDAGSTSTKTNILVTDDPDSTAWDSDIVMTGNPGLRNPSTNTGSADFRPNSGGSLIGKAAHNGNVPRDLVGTSRSGSIEPGAFEAEASSGR